MERVRIVATLREAYVLLGFPVSKAFLWAVIPTIVMILGGVLLWVAFADPPSSEERAKVD